MSTLGLTSVKVSKFMEMLLLNIFLLAGIIWMIIGIIQTGKSTEKLREMNARERKRLDALYQSEQTDLAHH